MDNFNEKLIQADSYVDLREYYKAIDLFRELIRSEEKASKTKKSPNQLVNLLYRIIGCYIVVGNLEKAEEETKRANNLEPDKSKYHGSMAAILQKRGEFEYALEEINIALEKSNNKVDLLRLKAAILHDLEKYDEAINLLTSLIEKDPKDFDSLLVRAGYYIKKNEIELALKDIDKAITAQPNNARGYHSKVLALYQHGKLKEAFEECELLIYRFKDYQNISIPLLQSIQQSIEQKKELDQEISKVKLSFSGFADKFVKEHENDIEYWRNKREKDDKSHIGQIIMLFFFSVLFFIPTLLLVLYGKIEGWGILPFFTVFTFLTIPLYLSIAKVKQDSKLATAMVQDHKSKRDIYQLVFANSGDDKNSKNIDRLIDYYKSNSIANFLLSSSEQNPNPTIKIVEKSVDFLDKPLGKKSSS